MAFSEEEFLEKLEKDRKFRLAIAGLIGYKEILTKLRKYDKELMLLLTELRKQNKILEEHTKKLDEHTRILQEHTEILKGYAMRFDEHTRILQEHTEILEEHTKRFDQLNERISLLEKKVEVTIGSVGKRWGHDFEKTVLEIFKKILEERGIGFGEVSKFRIKDVDGKYTGEKGKIIDVDIVVKDDMLYVIEVKSYAELDDVEIFYEKIRPVEKVLNRKAEKAFIVAINIDDDAYERAKELGIEVITSNIIPSLETETEHKT